MEATKLSSVLVIALVATTLVESCVAKRIQYAEEGQPGKSDMDAIVQCYKKCNAADGQCLIQCAETTFKGMPQDQLKTFFESKVVASRLVFCTLGCGLSDVCAEVAAIEEKREACVDGCAQFCGEELKDLGKH